MVRSLPANAGVVLVTQSCLTLCDPTDYSLPGSSVRGILQARILEWLPFSSPEVLPYPGIEPRSPALQADSLPSEAPGKPQGTQVQILIWEDSTCHWATKPMCHNCEPSSSCSATGSHYNEKPTYHN